MTWQTFKDYKEKGQLKPAEESARLALFFADPTLSFTGEIGDADYYASLGFAG